MSALGADAVEGDETPNVDLNEVLPTVDGKAFEYSIVLRSRTVGDVGVPYKIRTDETFERIYKDYASQIDVHHSQIKVFYGSTFIPSTAYPEAMGIDSGDVLFVDGQPGVVNTYTRIKRFYVKNTRHRKKCKLRVQAKLDTPLCLLFHIWGEKFDVDPTNLIFMHEDNVLKSIDTIREDGILNGDKVVVGPTLVE